jgi:hypothetical protein
LSNVINPVSKVTVAEASWSFSGLTDLFTKTESTKSQPSEMKKLTEGERPVNAQQEARLVKHHASVRFRGVVARDTAVVSVSTIRTDLSVSLRSCKVNLELDALLVPLVSTVYCPITTRDCSLPGNSGAALHLLEWCFAETMQLTDECKKIAKRFGREVKENEKNVRRDYTDGEIYSMALLDAKRARLIDLIATMSMFIR